MLKALKRSKDILWPLRPNGQTAVEYLLLFGVVMAIVLVAFRTHLPRVYPAVNTYFFNTFINELYGPPSPCGDGVVQNSEGPPHCSCPKDYSCP